MSTSCQNEAEFIAIIKSGEYGSLKSFVGNALHNAACYGYVEACNKLIDLGFDVNETNESTQRYAHLAVDTLINAINKNW